MVTTAPTLALLTMGTTAAESRYRGRLGGRRFVGSPDACSHSAKVCRTSCHSA